MARSTAFETMLKTPEAAAFCGVKESTLARLRQTGRGPAHFIGPGGRVLYRPAELTGWMASQARPPQSASGDQHEVLKCR